MSSGDHAFSIKDFLPTLKITYRGRLVYMDTVWLGRISKVDFKKVGNYIGCLYTLGKNLELMFVIERKEDKLYIKELFDRFEPFSCSLDNFVPSLIERRRD